MMPLLFGLLGMVAAAGGLTLLLMPSTVTVTLDSSGYRIGEHRLRPGPADTYTSAQADLVIARRDSGTVAAASSRLHGQPIVGRCDQAPSGGFEFCTFRLGTRTVTSEDIRTSSGWHRRYSDGQEVDIRTAHGRAVPVPFPVGR